MSVTESHGTPALATKREAADVLRVTTRTIDRWVTAGRLTPRYTPSGRPRFDRADLDSLLTTPVADVVPDPDGADGGPGTDDTSAA